ncbi:MAG: DUF1465 family protein [Pseudomonadota bacterium]
MANSEAYKDAVKHFAGSKLFFKVFDETIALVQKASDYLEGAGRFDQIRLEGKVATVFASESVKMTNRLMHTSSWLLSHRAFLKGELEDPKEIDHEEFLEKNNSESLDKLVPELPTRFVMLVTQSNLLFERIMRLDEQLRNIPGAKETDKDENTDSVHAQHNRIRLVLSGEGDEKKADDDILLV